MPPEMRSLIDELEGRATTTDSRKELSDFVLSINRAIRRGELPDISLPDYLRTLAQKLRSEGPKNSGPEITINSKSEWSLFARTFVRAFSK